MNERKVSLTADGSFTLFDPISGEHYHSMNGAIAESMHVFIQNGLQPAMLQHKKLKVLEYGFGTGLNAILTYNQLKDGDASCEYTTLEAFPLNETEIKQLNFVELALLKEQELVFEKMHHCPWNTFVRIDKTFSIKKIHIDFREFIPEREAYNLVFFDAFSPNAQAELWTPQLFGTIFQCLEAQGMLVTYSASGVVKRALREVGFRVKRLPGPPGKRHMLLATKEKSIQGLLKNTKHIDIIRVVRDFVKLPASVLGETITKPCRTLKYLNPVTSAKSMQKYNTRWNFVLVSLSHAIFFACLLQASCSCDSKYTNTSSSCRLEFLC